MHLFTKIKPKGNLKVYASPWKYRTLLGFWLLGLLAVACLGSWQLLQYIYRPQNYLTANLPEVIAEGNGSDNVSISTRDNGDLNIQLGTLVMPVSQTETLDPLPTVIMVWCYTSLPFILLLLVVACKFFAPLSRFMFDMRKIHYIDGGNKKVSPEEAMSNFISSYKNMLKKFGISDAYTMLLYENSSLISRKLSAKTLLTNFLANICSHDHRWVVGHIYIYDSTNDSYRQVSNYASRRFQKTAPVIDATFLNIFNGRRLDILQAMEQEITHCGMLICHNIGTTLSPYYNNKVKSLHIRSSLLYPIMLDNKVYAIVELLAKHNFSLNQEDLNVMQITGHQLSMALSENSDIHFDENLN